MAEKDGDVYMSSLFSVFRPVVLSQCFTSSPKDGCSASQSHWSELQSPIPMVIYWDVFCHKLISQTYTQNHTTSIRKKTISVSNETISTGPTVSLFNHGLDVASHPIGWEKSKARSAGDFTTHAIWRCLCQGPTWTKIHLFLVLNFDENIWVFPKMVVPPNLPF